MAKNDFSFTSFSYRHFAWMGRLIGRVFYSNGHAKLDETLEDTGLKIYPDAYFSMIGFFFILSIIATIPIVVLSRMWFLAPAPLLIVLLGYAIPKVMASDRAQKLDLEVPFAGTYMSVMATGGLSPYASLGKLKNCDLLPNMSKVINDIEIDVQVKGFDPVSAIEKSAQHLPSKDYRDLMLGYTSTLRTGGDVIHYLRIRTETMFKDLAIKVKAYGDRASVLMETYVTISILMTLTLTVMFMTSLSLQQFWQGSLSAATFLEYGYLIVPVISIMFIYISDTQQLNQPISDWRTFKVFLATLPVMIFLLLTMFLPFASQGVSLPFAQPFMNLVTSFRAALGLQKGYEAALGLAMALLVGVIPAAVAHSFYSQRGNGIEHDVTNFMRDLTEARKDRCLSGKLHRNPFRKKLRQIHSDSNNCRKANPLGDALQSHLRDF